MAFKHEWKSDPDDEWNTTLELWETGESGLAISLGGTGEHDDYRLVSAQMPPAALVSLRAFLESTGPLPDATLYGAGSDSSSSAPGSSTGD